MKRAQPKMFTVKQAAERLGAAESSVRMWVRRGRFAGARLEESPIGAFWLIPEDSIESFRMGKPGRKPGPKR
ncbi:MAG: helix-turn-helix domain-containing protein [Blastocatellia bacterium]